MDRRSRIPLFTVIALHHVTIFHWTVRRQGNVCVSLYRKWLLRFHKHGFAHQELDLTIKDYLFYQIKDCEPLLIDLDRMCLDNNRSNLYECCMYGRGFTPTLIDWMQLGWLAAWAYCNLTDTAYHERTFDNLPRAYCKDTFLKELINNSMVWLAMCLPCSVMFCLSAGHVIPTWLSIHFLCRCIWAAVSSPLHYLHQR